nr:MAG TPA: hypothetical protein [Caudoviricetes sp.]DAZ24886.1 MAG TPA: hypothetical protein [Caudoviricetes sp.]
MGKQVPGLRMRLRRRFDRFFSRWMSFLYSLILQNHVARDKDFRNFYIFYVMLLELQYIPDGVR